MPTIFKSKKVQIALATLVLSIIQHYVPQIPEDTAIYIVGLGGSLLFGHTITDCVSILKNKDK